MKLYYGKNGDCVEADVTPKMLRQMKDWTKRAIANVSIRGNSPGSKTYVLLHIDQINIALSIARSGK